MPWAKNFKSEMLQRISYFVGKGILIAIQYEVAVLSGNAQIKNQLHPFRCLARIHHQTYAQAHNPYHKMRYLLPQWQKTNKKDKSMEKD